MTDKELRKLSRVDLLELMLKQGKEIDQLRAIIVEQEAKLADRTIQIQEAGTIADASFALNGVLESAQAAAQQYLDNIKRLNGNQESICNAKIAEAEEKCNLLLQDTKEQCDAMMSEADKYVMEVKAEADQYVMEVKAEADQYNMEVKTEADQYNTTVRAEADKYHEEKKADIEKYVAENESASKNSCEMMLAQAEEESSTLKKDTEQECETLRKEAEDYSKKIRTEADHYHNEKIIQTTKEVESRWKNLSERLEDFYASHQGLKELLNVSTETTNNEGE